jgi:hypothetical protein
MTVFCAWFLKQKLLMIFRIAWIWVAVGITLSHDVLCDMHLAGQQDHFEAETAFIVLKRPKNVLDVMISDKGEGLRGEAKGGGQTSSVLAFRVTVDGETLLLLDPATLDTLRTQLPGYDAPVRFLIDDTTLPTGAPGTHEMVFSSPAVAQPLRLQVQIGCSDPQRATYLDCIANCAHWEVRW